MSTNEKEKKILDQTIGALNKRFGANTLMWMGSEEATLSVDAIPTQSLGLNKAIGVGGIPRGRITEVYGPEASGKTGVVLGVIAEAQKAGGRAAFIDLEYALDPLYASIVGVDMDEYKFLYIQPDNAEAALEILGALVSTNAFDVIAIDSVAALVPEAEAEADMSQNSIGLQARLMSKAMRKLTPLIGKSKTAVIFINQLREKVGVMYG